MALDLNKLKAALLPGLQPQAATYTAAYQAHIQGNHTVSPAVAPFSYSTPTNPVEPDVKSSILTLPLQI